MLCQRKWTAAQRRRYHKQLPGYVIKSNWKYLGFDLGTDYFNDRLLPYLSFGAVNLGNRGVWTLTTGIDGDLNWHNSLKMQLNLLYIPPKMGLAPYLWHQPTPKRRDNTKGGYIFVGTELKARLNFDRSNFLERNIHLGISKRTAKSAFFRQFYAQIGYGYNYLGPEQRALALFAQIGFNGRLLAVRSY